MNVIITLTSAGANISDTLDLYTNATGEWVFFANVTKTDLLSGYFFTPPEGAFSYQLRDLGNCGATLTLMCEGLTTTTTSTLTTTTTHYDKVDPGSIDSGAEGGNFSVNLIHPEFSLTLIPTPEHEWVSATVNPTTYIYSTEPLLYYNVMTVVIDADLNVEDERLSEVRINTDTELFGVVAIRQFGLPA